MTGPSISPQLSRNQTYLLDAFERSGAKVGLDYGCGEGALVAAAVDAGHDFWGSETYYDGESDYQESAQASTPASARDRIRLLEADNTIPWPDGAFDWVCSGQVFEHVHDLDRAVAEIARVTKPGGLGLHTFPVTESIVEQHNGVPLYHRLSRRARRGWARAWYEAGVAHRFGHASFDTWFDETDKFFEESVVLRKRKAIVASFERYFQTKEVSTEKLSFHLPVDVPNVGLVRSLETRRHGVALSTVRRLSPGVDS